MQYGNYEFIAYHGGVVYRDVFIAVALMAGPGPIDSLFRLAVMFGLVLTILRAIGDFNFATGLRWFLTAAMIYGVLWIPKVRVHVTDRFDTSFAGADVANVPLGIAFAATTASEIGDTAISLTETAFADPTGLAYSQNGLIYGGKVFDDMHQWNVLDTGFRLNLLNFVQSCSIADVNMNPATLATVETSTDLWATLVSSANPALLTSYTPPGSTVSQNVSCTYAAGQLDGQWTNEVSNNESVRHQRLLPSSTLGGGGPAFDTSLSALTQAAGIGSASGAQTMQQVLIIKVLQQGMSASTNTQGIAGALADAQAQVQTRDTQQMIGQTAEKALVVLQIVFTVLFIGVFPIMAPMFILPSIGLQMMKGYFAGFIYLQLWGPMYVILHKIMMWQVYTQTAAGAYSAATMAGSPSALTFANLNLISNLNADLAGTAGCLAITIPAIAAMLTKGAIAGGEAAAGGMMHSYSRAAEAAGTAAATGSYSFGNSTVDTHSMHNTTGNQRRTREISDVGGSTYTDRQGNIISRSPDGMFTTMQAAQSQVPFSVGLGTQLANRLDESAATTNSKANSLQEAVNYARTRVEREERARTQTTSVGSSATVSQGLDHRGQTSNTEGEQVRIGDRKSGTHSASVGSDDSWSVTQGASVRGDGSLGAKVAGIGLSAGVGGSVGGSHQHTHKSADNTVGEGSHDVSSSRELSTNRNEQIAKYATEYEQSLYGKNSADAFITADTVSSSEGLSKTQQQMRTSSQSYSRLAQATRSDSADVNSQLGTLATSYIMESVARNPYAYRLSNGTVLSAEEVVNPQNTKAAPEIVALRSKDLEENFLPQYFSSKLGNPEFQRKLSEGAIAAPPSSIPHMGALGSGPGGLTDGPVSEMLKSVGERVGGAIPTVNVTPMAVVQKEAGAAGAAAQHAVDSSHDILANRARVAHAQTGAGRLTSGNRTDQPAPYHHMTQ